MDIISTFVVKLPGGAELSLEASQEFINKLVKHFELADDTALTNEHVQKFLAGALDAAQQKL